MIKQTFAAIAVGFCSLGPAYAEDTPPDQDGGRYTFSKTADGFVRLDSETGEVSVCSQRAVGWACQAVPEDRAVLENKIVRLRRENAALKKDLLAHGLPLPDGAIAEAPVAADAGSPHTPADSDLDRVVALVGRVWHRLVEAITQAQKQVLNKS